MAVAKITMAQAVDLAVPILSAPRKIRDMIEAKLRVKREQEDAAKAQGDGQPELPGGVA